MDLVGHGAFRPTHLGIVAQNHHFLGDADPALRRLDEALERTTTSGELVHQPDLLRLRAEIMTAAYPDRMDEAVEDLVAAIEIGLAQGSLVLALRAANDLARLPHDSAPDWTRPAPRRARAVPAQFLEPRTGRGARPPRGLRWRAPAARWPSSAAAWARWPPRSSSAKGTGPTGSTASPSTSGDGASAARGPAAGDATAASRSTGCTCSSATTTTPSTSCDGATRRSTAAARTRPVPSGRGTTPSPPRTSSA